MSALEDAARAMCEAFAESDTQVDIGPHLTCAEADLMAEVFRAAGLDRAAAYLIEGHAAEDDAGDAHYAKAGADLY